MGYHAIGIGDDDLSLGKKFLVELSKTFNITFLSSNVIDEESGKTLFQRYIIKEVNGLKIGIFSLLAPDVFFRPVRSEEKGIDFSGKRPEGLNDLPQIEMDYLITMGCEETCPAVLTKKIIEWDIPDPKGKPIDVFRGVRDLVEERVRLFLKEIN